MGKKKPVSKGSITENKIDDIRLLEDFIDKEATTQIAALEDKDYKNRARAVIILGGMNFDDFSEFLIPMLWDKHWFVRSYAAYVLGNIEMRGDTDPVKYLIEALMDKSHYVRQSAAKALGNMGDPRAIEALITALSDKHQIARLSAVYALVRIGDPRIADLLIPALKDEDARCWAARVLGEMGDPRAIPHLEALLRTVKNENIRKIIQEALRKIPQKWANKKINIPVKRGMSDHEGKNKGNNLTF